MDDSDETIPLTSLPKCKIKAHTLDEVLTANNVLIYALDKLETAVLGGIDKEGNWYFASSMEDPEEVRDHLKKFKRIMKGY